MCIGKGLYCSRKAPSKVKSTKLRYVGGCRWVRCACCSPTQKKRPGRLLRHVSILHGAFLKCFRLGWESDASLSSRGGGERGEWLTLCDTGSRRCYLVMLEVSKGVRVLCCIPDVENRCEKNDHAGETRDTRHRTRAVLSMYDVDEQRTL